MGKFVDLIGKKFGRLTVIKNNGINKKGGYTWECSCECGGNHIVRSDMLKNGDVKSCGCIRKPSELEMLENLRKNILRSTRKEKDCLIWIRKSKNAFGYGIVIYKGKYIGAHRAAWIAWRGEIPKGLFVLHKCDVPECCSPDHLFLGTQRENIHDRMRKGRSIYSEKTQFKKSQKPHNTILNESQVKEIREQRLKGELMKDLAIKYNVTRYAISDLIKRKSWKHI